jgi:hypothetical protein
MCVHRIWTNRAMCQIQICHFICHYGRGKIGRLEKQCSFTFKVFIWKFWKFVAPWTKLELNWTSYAYKVNFTKLRETFRFSELLFVGYCASSKNDLSSVASTLGAQTKNWNKICWCKMEADMEKYLYDFFTNRLASDGFFSVEWCVANAIKLKKHRISNESPICSACGKVDKNVHRLKLCLGSRIIWMWIANKLWQRLNVNVDDPEVKKLWKEEEAGLWFVMAAIHYNFHNFKDGTLSDFLNQMRVSRLLNKEYVERWFGVLLRIF